MMRRALGCNVLLCVLALGFAACQPGSVFLLEVGDCFQAADLAAEETTEVSEVPLVDCDEPHDTEVYAVFDLPDGDYPEGVQDLAMRSCEGERFTEYVGSPVMESEFSLGVLWPTREGWNEGDRGVVCYLYRDDLEPMIGSQRGVAAAD